MEHSDITQSLRIQSRVIDALLRREFIALTGKSAFGFLMLLIEPLLFVLGLSLLTIMFRKTLGNIPIVPFALSGYSILWCVRFHIIRSAGVVNADVSLLYHRYVTVFDILLARSILLVFITTPAFLLFIPLIFYNVIEYPDDLALVIIPWLFVQWYGMSFAFITGAISKLYKIGIKLGAILQLVHIWSTGAIFMVDWIPFEYQDYFLAFPMVHATEMMRDGLFGNKVVTHYSVGYMTMGNIVISFVALYLCRKLTKSGGIND